MCMCLLYTYNMYRLEIMRGRPNIYAQRVLVFLVRVLVDWLD